SSKGLRAAAAAPTAPATLLAFAAAPWPAPVPAGAPPCEPPPAVMRTRNWLAAISVEPQAVASLCRATMAPSISMVGSPLTIEVGPHFGQATLSPTRATGLPSISVKGDPVTTTPPCVVLSPTTIHGCDIASLCCRYLQSLEYSHAGIP